MNGKYFYSRKRSFWVVLERKDDNTADIIAEYPTQVLAKEKVYELNGWGKPSK